MASVTPLFSRKEINKLLYCELSALLSAATISLARPSSSLNCESRAARPKLKPDSSAESTRTLNQDSMERDMN